jgi:hypothetical protein
MAASRRSHRPRRNESFWTDYLRSGVDEAVMPETTSPTVAEAEQLLEEARRAEAERAAALARQVEEDKRRRAVLERDTAAAVDTIEERLDSEIATARTAVIPADRELRVLCRGFLHGFAPRSGKRLSPPDLIAARDDAAAQLLEISREAELLYDRLTSSWAEVALPPDHPFVLRTDAVEIAAWQGFVERVKVLAGECSAPRRTEEPPLTEPAWLRDG